jgi:hypothetical protein
MVGICGGFAEKRAGDNIDSAGQIAAYFVPVDAVEFPLSAVDLRVGARTAWKKEEKQKEG